MRNDDRHHFRFIVSPDDAGEVENLRTFTRELMDQASRDLGTRLDGAAIDHWNTEHPHVHILVRGCADDGKDLVISRDYISTGFRARAGNRVTRELLTWSAQNTGDFRGTPHSGPVNGGLCCKTLLQRKSQLSEGR